MDLSAVGHHLWLLHDLAVKLRSDSYVLHLVFVPLDLELRHSWLFCQDVSRQLGDVRSGRRVFNQVWELFAVGVVHVVPHSEELLRVVVAASQQNCSHSNDVVGGQFRHVGDVALIGGINGQEKGIDLHPVRTPFDRRPRSPFQLLLELSHTRRC